MTDSTPDPTAQTRREWTLGSYPAIGRAFLPMAARLVDVADVDAGDRVLDVACGTGNVALTAHRRGAHVAGVDVTPAMLEMARDRASVTDADVDWREGDAVSLPFEDDAFDVTLSCLGHMFAPDAEATGTELVRVTRPGGTVAFTAWTPGSGIATMMGVVASYLPPPPEGFEPPFLWGDPETVRGRLEPSVDRLRFETGTVRYPAASPAHFWDAMTTHSGPVIVALEGIDDGDRPVLREEVVDVLTPFFAEADNVVELTYRTVTATAV